MECREIGIVLIGVAMLLLVAWAMYRKRIHPRISRTLWIGSLAVLAVTVIFLLLCPI